MTEFTTKDGSIKRGEIIRAYRGYEDNEVRYIFIGEDHREYRCIRKEERYVEYVA